MKNESAVKIKVINANTDISGSIKAEEIVNALLWVRILQLWLSQYLLIWKIL